MNKEKEITIAALEEKLFNFELVRVVFRAPKTMMVKDYPYVRAIGDDAWIDNLYTRIKSTYPDLDYVVVNGRGSVSYLKRAPLGKIRDSYID